MTLLGWGTLVLLTIMLSIAWSQGMLGGVLGVLALLAVVGFAWLAIGTLVQRDARKHRVADSEHVGDVVMTYGPFGLLYWFGLRRPRAKRDHDHTG